MKTIKAVLVLAMVSVLFPACNNFSESESGLRYRILKRGNQKSLPQIGEYVQCYYSIANSEDSIFLSYFGKTPDRVLLTQATHKGGDIMEALGMLSEGDSATFLISADSFFLKTRREIIVPKYVKPGTDLKFVIKMDKRLNKRQVDSLINQEKIARWNEEIKNINKYISKKGLSMTLDTATGIRYQFYQHSDTGSRVSEDKLVQFHMIGKLMDDTEFFNSYTNGGVQTVRVRKEEFNPIGMYEILTRMKEGEKAIFILPYDLAYGSTGVDQMIPPFSTLVYEINLLKVR